MIFTVDDADPSFAYTGGWAVQSDSDPDRDEFFQGTYHVATNDDAEMSFQFSGIACTIYGSKGPGHAKYRVLFDNVVINLDAYADETAFQQPLFTHTFNTSATHSVTLTAIFSGDNIKGRWLDVDYISFTSGNGTTSAIGTATSLPPWETISSSTSSSSLPFSTSQSNASSSSSTSSNRLPTILAIVFGVILGLGLVFLAAYLILRRIQDHRRARERAFRYGQSSVHTSSITPEAYYSSDASGSGSSPGVLGTFSKTFWSLGGGNGGGREARSPHGSEMQMRENMSPGAYTPVHGGREPSMSTSLDVRDRDREGAGTPSTARPLLSSSPLAWTKQKVGGGHRGDADSLRTDFLQV